MSALWDKARGGFYASQDADIGPHDDGDYYTWTLDEVRALLASAKQRLLAARDRRPTPFIDRTIYAGWNGMAISACFEVFKGLLVTEARAMALRALDRILTEAPRPGEGVYHLLTPDGPVHPGLLDDQVFIAQACLDAFEVTAEERYLTVARDLAENLLREHEDSAGGVPGSAP